MRVFARNFKFKWCQCRQ